MWLRMDMQPLWVLLSGVFYFFYKGMWMEAVLRVIIAVTVAIPTMGFGVIVLDIVLAFIIGNLIRNSYRKNGWKDVVQSVGSTDE